MNLKPHIITSETVGPSVHSRFLATWWGSFIGDALAMPVHWYYKRELIDRDYGNIAGYHKPISPHPDSILWRSRYESTCKEDDILHDQAQYWGKTGIHYHQFLEAGENTINLQISTLLAESLIENDGYNQKDFAERYIHFMQNPSSHKDTYLEEYHRNFFQNLARGKPLEKCGSDDIHIGCLATLTPLILFYHKDRDLLNQKVKQHVQLTHKGANASRAGELFADTLHYLLKCNTVETAVFNKIGRDTYQTLSNPFRRWIENHVDEEVVGKLVSTACYLEDALPATYYLALKYADKFEEGLIKNTHLGGDNCHRGVALGAILGAANGCENIPVEWVQGLKNFSRYDQLGDALWAAQN